MLTKRAKDSLILSAYEVRKVLRSEPAVKKAILAALEIAEKQYASDAIAAQAAHGETVQGARVVSDFDQSRTIAEILREQLE